MPRETITGTGRDVDGFVVQVGWASTHNDVQLGIETSDGRSLVTQLYGSAQQLERIGKRAVAAGWRTMSLTPDLEGLNPEQARALAETYREIGREVLNAVQDGPDPATREEARPTYGYENAWTHLDRSGVNRLVKVLRRARDAAFGADE